MHSGAFLARLKISLILLFTAAASIRAGGQECPSRTRQDRAGVTVAAMGPLPRNWVPQQPHPASHWVPSAVVGASTTASWGKGEEPQPETLGTPRARRLTWDPLKSRVRLVGLDTSPMEMCPTSEPASRRMGFPHRSPATPGGQRAPGAGGACTQPQETGCPQARPCAGRALQALPAARAALREGPVGAAHPPGLYPVSYTHLRAHET